MLVGDRWPISLLVRAVGKLGSVWSRHSGDEVSVVDVFPMPAVRLRTKVLDVAIVHVYATPGIGA